MPTAVIKQLKNESADFYTPPPEHVKYVNDTYVNTGKLNIVRTVDGNTAETTFHFTTAEDRLAFLADPVVVAQKRISDAQCQAANLVITTATIE